MSEVMKLLVVIYGLKSWTNLVHQQSCIGKLVIGMVFNYSPQFAFNPPLATCRYNYFYIFAVVCGIGLCGSESILIYVVTRQSHFFTRGPGSTTLIWVILSIIPMSQWQCLESMTNQSNTNNGISVYIVYLIQQTTSNQQLLNKVMPACFQFNFCLCTSKEPFNLRKCNWQHNCNQTV